MADKIIRRLKLLQNEADQTPVPARKYFHIGQAEALEDVGECVPMIPWVDDNLSRFVVADAASASWGRQPGAIIVTLPNLAVKVGDGVFVVTGPGRDETLPHPQGKGAMHFVHLGLPRPWFDRGVSRLYVYRLDGVQVKGMAAGDKRP